MNPNDSCNGRRDFRRGALISLLLGLGLFAACRTERQTVAAREDHLAAAGFIARPANTPERQAMLKRLPAHKFVQRTHGNTIHYVYADPLVCQCLYIGSQQAYDQFKRDEENRKLADEQLMTAQQYSDPAWNWGAWGPWGPEAPFPYEPGLGW